MSVSSLSPLAATVASLIGWAFLPDFLTVTALRLARRAGLAFAQSPAIPTSSRAYRITYSLVIASYLIYTIVAAVYTAPRNLYEVLGCTPGATETDLKYAYRSFAKKFHPDRIGPEGEAAFIVIRDAFETLKSPVKRFAYDRFGPDALEWTAATYREAIHQGLTASLGFYISTTIFTIIVALNNHSQVLTRSLLLSTLFALELSLTLNAGATSIPHLNFILPHYLPFQHVSLLRQCCFSLSVALYRIVPVLSPQEPLMTRLARAEGGPTGEEAIQALTPHILNLARSVDQVTAESIRMLQTELTAIHGTRPIPQHLANYVRTRMVPEFPISDEILVHLVREMHKIEFGTQVRSNPALRAMLQDAVNRGYAKSVAQAQAQALAQAQVQAQAPQAAAVSADGVVSDGGAGATQAALPTPGSSAVPAGEPLPPAAAQLQLQSQTLPQPPSQPIAAPIPPPEPLKQIYQTFSNVRLGDVD